MKAPSPPVHHRHGHHSKPPPPSSTALAPCTRTPNPKINPPHRRFRCSQPRRHWLWLDGRSLATSLLLLGVCKVEDDRTNLGVIQRLQILLSSKVNLSLLRIIKTEQVLLVSSELLVPLEQ
jgi:hypothetical protein